MSKARLVPWALSLLLAGASAAGELAGARFPDRITVEGTNLVLNGMGVRKAYAVAKVYVAGLYLEQRSTRAEAILASDSVRRVELRFLRDVSRDQIVAAWNEGFEKNAGANLPGLRARIEALNRMMTDLAAGDVLAFTAVPGRGTLVDLGGKSDGTIEGDDFARALLSIWIGESPPNAALKSGLLGL